MNTWSILSEKPDQPLPEDNGSEASALHDRAVAQLETMLSASYPSCTDPTFVSAYTTAARLLEQFQSTAIDFHGAAVSCHRGCSRCCFHWVEDVSSFEAQIMADFIKTRIPSAAAGIRAACLADIDHYAAVRTSARSRLAELKSSETTPDLDTLSLASFYQLRRPCPLLDRDGACTAYSVRPIACRIYLSFSPPKLCDPDVINEGNTHTFTFALDERGMGLFDKIDSRYGRPAADHGLRSLLAAELG